ncbi:MAG: chemotaxis protein [Desulfovibrionaceae bacterium]|nr:chemotaxis protein [Desulfovibrionaceae bacterium]
MKIVPSMLKRSLLILILAQVLLLAACGPKDIGSDYTAESDEKTSVSVAEQMRYPLFGSDGNQRMLYMHNRMDTMVARQKFMNAKLQNKSGLSPEDPNYRSTPKERSPFRE